MLITQTACHGCGHRFPDRPGSGRLLCNVCRSKAERLSRGEEAPLERTRGLQTPLIDAESTSDSPWRICGACGRWVASKHGQQTDCGACDGGRL